MNSITVEGNAGRDAELRYTQSGRAVCSFSVADSKRYEVNGEWREETNWWDCSIWGDAAERAADRIKKGDKLVLIGEAGSRQWSDQSGQARFSLTLNVFKHRNHTYREDNQNGQAQSYAPPAQAPAPATAQPQATAEPETLTDLPW